MAFFGRSGELYRNTPETNDTNGAPFVVVESATTTIPFAAPDASLALGTVVKDTRSDYDGIDQAVISLAGWYAIDIVVVIGVKGASTALTLAYSINDVAQGGYIFMPLTANGQRTEAHYIVPLTAGWRIGVVVQAATADLVNPITSMTLRYLGPA